jgi:phosphocarrier protein HPr
MEIEIILKDSAGLHAKLASKVVQAASKYDVDIRLIYKDKMVDAKSILGLISLAIPSGKNVRIIADGDQAEKAIKDSEKLIG